MADCRHYDRLLIIIKLSKVLWLPAQQVIDLQFSDFIQHQVGCVRRAYQHFGWDLSAAVSANMQRFLDSHPADRHGRHVYSFADIGMDLEQVRKLFRPYQEHFGIPDEPL